MNLDQLEQRTGEWLRGTGPEADIVISSRIRLARNLADFPFTNRASILQKGEIESLLREKLTKLPSPAGELGYLQIHSLAPIEREFLRERQLISREHVGTDGPRGVAFDAREACSVMVNEEDHLRIQVIRSGLALDDAWQEIDRLDDLIEERVSYAFHDDFGYLTACPTNVGTGMRASVMMHLPALNYTKSLEKVFRGLQKINLAVRGLYGEGTRASGDFYQISNQVTLGKAETEILAQIGVVVPEILDYERKARETLLKEHRTQLLDRVSRAFGTLQAANLMTSEETMDLLSTVRLGVHLKLIEEVTPTVLNELFLQTQPAHLQRLAGKVLDNDERNELRAKHLRLRLRRGMPNL